MTRMKPKDLDVGMRFVEHDSFCGSVTCEVTEKPVEGEGHEGRSTWKWKAKNVETGREIDYMITEGFEHYGPHIYSVGSVLIPRKWRSE